MSLRSTKLSTIIARMQRYQDVLQNSNEIYIVRDLDEEIRAVRRLMPFPWTLQKGSLRVFEGVKEYAVAADHDELAYLDTDKNVYYSQRARFKYTSLQQFYEDPNNRNQMAEIFDGNHRFLGVNYKNIATASRLLNNCENAADFTVTGDAGTPVLDQVMYKEGAGSIRIPITNSANTASIRCAYINSVNDSAYKKKYQFVWIYLDAVPTSIELRHESSAVNYLYTTGITTQFDGSPFKADAWNLVAQDLNLASQQGTFDSTAQAFGRVVLTGAATGTYFIDAFYLREWELMDYWYYSIYNVLASGGTLASKEYFYNDDAAPAYDTSDALIGDSEWADVIQYGAMINNLIDIKASKDSKSEFLSKREAAWQALIMKYPSLEPVIITDRYNFEDDFISPTPYVS